LTGISASSALIVFGRAPRAGRVKSRLAAGIGPARAADTYARLLDHALEIAGHADFTRYYFYCADVDEMDYFRRRLNPDHWSVASQSDGNIGDRMLNAFTAVLGEHSRVVLIGSDVIDSTAGDLEQARSVLETESHGAVLGPSADGGYWLLGLCGVNQILFDGIRWSTAEVAARTLANLRSNGSEVFCLPVRHDVDVAADMVLLEEE